jgi:transcriptional antiterminator NusG
MLTKTTLDPVQVRLAEKVAEQKWGPDWRSKRLETYFAEMIDSEPPPIPAKFDGAWFVVQSEPQQEKAIAAGLIGNRFPFYLPMRSLKVRVNDRRHRMVDRPMLAGYLFASFDPAGNEWKRINSIAGVIGVLGYDLELAGGVIERRPVPVPIAMMIRIRDKEAEMAKGHRVVRACNNEELALGAVIQVKDGPFAAFFGRVIELSFKKERLKAEIDLFGRPTPVELEAWQVMVI